MTVQGALWLAKSYASTLISVSLTGFRYFSYQVTAKLSSQDWVDPVTDPILPEKFLGYSRESNPGSLGWQSDVLTTVPNRWSPRIIISININNRIISRIWMNGIKISNYKFKWILANISITDMWTKFDRAILKRHLSPCNTEMSLIEENNKFVTPVIFY